MFGKKKIEPICKNCRLYNPESGKCGVAVLYAGHQFHLPVEPNDECFFEGEFVAIDGKSFKPEVQEVKWWVEDEKGNKTTGEGTVKIQYPEGFFGGDIVEGTEEDLL